MPDTDNERLGNAMVCCWSKPLLWTEHSRMIPMDPLIGPDAGLDEVISMINSATDSIHLHVYQLHDAYLSMALIEASNRGVDITVVIHEPETWWGIMSSDKALALLGSRNAGITVMQFTTSSSSPYQYIHSKVAVVDSTHVWIKFGNWKSSSLPSDGIGNRDWGNRK